MQKPDEQKRRDIINAAARLFSNRSFHEVRLEDVATAARIGKGTIYIYFQSKEDLFASIIREGMRSLVEDLNEVCDRNYEGECWEALSTIVRELCAFAICRPHMFQVMRSDDLRKDPQVVEIRRELGKLIERVLRRGIKRGEFVDAHPELTAQFIPGAVRAAVYYGPRDVSAKVLAGHLLKVIGCALGVKEHA